VCRPCLGWRLTIVDNTSGADLWFSDGGEVGAVRGGSGLSSRLIVGGQGFLDITDLILPNNITIDLNGYNIYGSATELLITIGLRLPGDGTFTATASDTVSGSLKPLPEISRDDIVFIDQKIKDKYIPYQNIPDAPGKTDEQIRKLGEQFFPFTSHSFELAMCVYDWTTASFARMVFLKVFEYTGMEPDPFYPLNKSEVAKMIWESNWGTYTPHDPDFMNSFMMVPADSLANVRAQLDAISEELQKFSTIQNRVLATAIYSMPRTSIFSKQRLFSGQVDIYQFGLDRFGTGFLECPLNTGPVSDSMTIDFETVLSTYVSPGNTITTKMVWSFTDTVQDAIHYSNGILLVANPPDDNAWIWEQATYVTPLSNDPEKIEYIFPPRSRFLVLSVDRVTVEEKNLVVINLQPLPRERFRAQHQGREDKALNAVKSANLPQGPMSLQEFEAQAALYSPILEKKAKDAKAALSGAEEAAIPHKTGGRWCRCVDAIKA